MRLVKIGAVTLFAGALCLTFSLPAQAAPRDSDHDGIPNSWEIKYKLNPRSAADGKKDFDHDGLNNRLEYKLHGNPRDEDTDNDGQDDGDERKTRTKVNRADTDRDGILDGDEDYDHDGIANEDEDDAKEKCAADDDDTDGDFVADEDENELRLIVGKVDSDNDGLPDGFEDSSHDGKANKDEDDDKRDKCGKHDRNHDGVNDEDEVKVVGVIASFADGVLTYTTPSGITRTVKVDRDTELEWEKSENYRGHEDEEDAALGDLKAGVAIAELERDEDSPTFAHKIKMYLA